MNKLLSRFPRENGFEITLAGFALLYLLLFAGLPLLYNIVLSFQQVDLMEPATLLRPFAGLANYRDVFSRPEAGQVLSNTLQFVGLSLLFQVVIGFLLAMLFLQDFPLATFMRGLFLAGWIMPGLVVGVIWKLLFAGDYGVLNHVLTQMGILHSKIFWLSDPQWSLYAVIIANVWLGVPFNMLLLSVGLAAIPADLYEAAELDGANAWQRFWGITLPMMKSTLGAVVSLGAIMTMQQFDLLAALTQGGPANSSQVAQYWSWQLSLQTFEVSAGSAVATLMMVLVLIVAVIYVRSTRNERMV
ncbi:carbohydrate ABC transporter permease [Amantichitinum ursilacus]|uniref:Lactose transport system permease protein LacF n=1 Tax=Amantichitinum ursilacus TaxID=857265 RepID=A0A0N0XIU9_9NEIS|nr:sugar ABC transporter permease [Amantichitinum ursilacus]KPC50453.1 Lactose transport system permease protein LacF [Amantichitinum ursilacus]